MIFVISMRGAETETILKEISSQITEIEATEKKITDIKNFLDESLKKQQQQRAEATEKLANVFNKKKNELLEQGLGKIKEESFQKGLQIAIQAGEKNTVAQILKRLPEEIKIDKSVFDILSKYNLITEHKILNDKNITDEKIMVIEKDKLPKIINLEEALKVFIKNPKLLEIKSEKAE